MPEVDNGFVDIYLFKNVSGIPNYFDRRIFYYASLSEYLNLDEDYESEEDINFNPADGIKTMLDVATTSGGFSYLLVVNPITKAIISRWFIIEEDRLLAGQLRLSLRRDVVGESISNRNFIVDSPIYVEKGILGDEDPMIVNSEGIEFNKIKKNETLVHWLDYGLSFNYPANRAMIDKFKMGCIVGYFERGAGKANIGISYEEDTSFDSITASDIATQTGIPLQKVIDMLDGQIIPFAEGEPELVFGMDDSANFFYSKAVIILNNSLSTMNYAKLLDALSWANPVWRAQSATTADYIVALQDGMSWYNSQSDSAKRTAFDTVIGNDVAGEIYLGEDELFKLRQFEGKIIYRGGKYYTLHFESPSGTYQHNEVVISRNENTFFNNFATSLTTHKGTVTNNWDMYLNYRVTGITIRLETYTTTGGAFEYMTDISTSARTLKDAPYSMFYIPFGDDVRFYWDEDDYTDVSTLSKEVALRMATEIAIQLGDKLYDLQLLPYLPEELPMHWYAYNIGEPDERIEYGFDIGRMISDYKEEFGVDANPNGKLFNYITDTQEMKSVGVLFYAEYSNFSKTIYFDKEAENNPKIESQCNFYRLCSPNYDGVFEFNLAKNGMSIKNFLINCTYKPFNPLIRVQPYFTGLYGTTFTDGRGLICGGDFSLPIVKDQWITYQQNNKNFATMFARDIQNLDVAQRQEKFKESVALGAGIVGGAGAGAAAGAKVGGGWGALAGGAIGLGTGIAGAILEAPMGAERRAEAKDYMIDRFNMQLANIKALPQTLARNSSFTIINKLFPFLEYYSCTEEEKEALQNKITYDGMTVGRIDYINNFISSDNSGSKYFKGQLIRAEGIAEDNHYINALYEEIAKGVYI